MADEEHENKNDNSANPFHLKHLRRRRQHHDNRHQHDQLCHRLHQHHDDCDDESSHNNDQNIFWNFLSVRRQDSNLNSNDTIIDHNDGEEDPIIDARLR